MEVHACPHHEKVAADVDRHQQWVETVQAELREHCRNSGSGHVTRGEFDKLDKQLSDIRTLLLKALVGMLVVASGGSALGPTLKALLMPFLGIK